MASASKLPMHEAHNTACRGAAHRPFYKDRLELESTCNFLSSFQHYEVENVNEPHGGMPYPHDLIPRRHQQKLISKEDTAANCVIQET